jgi:hypothetical protein
MLKRITYAIQYKTAKYGIKLSMDNSLKGYIIIYFFPCGQIGNYLSPSS